MYFSFWYKPSERALRIGIFHAANALASGVGGFIAVGVDHLNGNGGLESWRYVFIIEGAMAIGSKLINQCTNEVRADADFFKQ
jgi:MFS family permease